MSHHVVPCPQRHRFGPTGGASTSLRMLLVTGLTLATMVVEIVAGWLLGSVALLADGIHMGTHARALGAAVLAHRFAHRHAADATFSFGTGKVEALAAFGSTILLALAAITMSVEAIERLIEPQPIRAGEALVVAVVGLVVNVASAIMLGHGGASHETHGHDHNHDGTPGHTHDLNLRAAYIHVIADALTSVLAIIALIAAATAGLIWLDPVVACIASLVILRWAWGLVGESSAVLLDREAPLAIRHAVERAIESDAVSRVTDLHIWPLAAGRYTLIATVETGPSVTPDEIKSRLPARFGLVHPIVEVNRRPGDFRASW